MVACKDYSEGQQKVHLNEDNESALKKVVMVAEYDRQMVSTARGRSRFIHVGNARRAEI